MDNLQKQIGEWNIETFGKTQPKEVIHNHLAKEIAEVMSSKSIEDEVEELSDCIILILARFARLGISAKSIVEWKFAIDKTRTYKQYPDGCWHHVKE